MRTYWIQYRVQYGTSFLFFYVAIKLVDYCVLPFIRSDSADHQTAHAH